VLCARDRAAEQGRQRWQAQSHLTRACAMRFRTVSSRVRCAQSRVHSPGRGGLARGRHRSEAHSSVLFFSYLGQVKKERPGALLSQQRIAGMRKGESLLISPYQYANTSLQLLQLASSLSKKLSLSNSTPFPFVLRSYS
jgi:hypothetical protein